MGHKLCTIPKYSLFQLTQEEYVTQFYNLFTTLANRVHGVIDEILLDCFVIGLKKELQA